MEFDQGFYELDKNLTGKIQAESIAWSKVWKWKKKDTKMEAHTVYWTYEMWYGIVKMYSIVRL